MAAIGALPLGAAASAGGRARPPAKVTSRFLVSYFSRSGNTRVIAGLFQRAFGADLVEIRPAAPYPVEYLPTVEQARQERDSGYEPALESRVPNMAAYETIYLGFPIWGETAPPIIRAFLSAHDVADKTLVPFITHGGYGLGSSLSVLASHAPKAKLRRPLVMEADQERRTMDRVNEWIAANGAKRANAN